MTISIIVAAAENGAIGRNGELPWHLPADLKRFKQLTVGHVVIMGRKTHESIARRLGRPLPKRRSLVLSRDPSSPADRAPGVEMVASLERALELAAGDSEVFVIGGAGVFARALPLAGRLYLTRVHAEVEGDVFFPELDTGCWRLVSEVRHPADERHAHAFSFLVYDRAESRPPPAAEPN